MVALYRCAIAMGWIGGRSNPVFFVQVQFGSWLPFGRVARFLERRDAKTPTSFSRNFRAQGFHVSKGEKGML